MNDRHFTISLVIFGALAMLSCSNFGVQVADDPRESGSAVSSIARQELSSEQADSTDGRDSFVQDLKSYQSFQNSSVLGLSKTKELQEIYGIEHMGITAPDQATLYSFTTIQNKQILSSSIILNPNFKQPENISGCGILNAQPARLNYQNRAIDQANLTNAGFFDIHDNLNSVFELSSIHFKKTIKDILPTLNNNKVRLSGSTDTTIQEGINFRIINNDIYRSEGNLNIKTESSEKLAKIIIDFHGSEESRASIIRCITKPGQTVAMNNQMQQLLVPIKGISVAEVQSIISDNINEIKTFRNIYQ